MDRLVIVRFSMEKSGTEIHQFTQPLGSYVDLPSPGDQVFVNHRGNPLPFSVVAINRAYLSDTHVITVALAIPPKVPHTFIEKYDGLH
ncbi:hypothetical protein [Acidovorax sp.]|uniref:hypothetical protein n=1 Tax=Acidovorax sp. TaxID=1872122 RepID=UPI00391F6D27